MNGKTICATNSVYDSDNKLKYDKKKYQFAILNSMTDCFCALTFHKVDTRVQNKPVLGFRKSVNHICMAYNEIMKCMCIFQLNI